MEEYTVITQGNAIYLEGKLGDEEQLDEVDRGMLVSNQIAGFLPLSVQWVNGNCRLLYNITGLNSRIFLRLSHFSANISSLRPYLTNSALLFTPNATAFSILCINIYEGDEV